MARRYAQYQLLTVIYEPKYCTLITDSDDCDLGLDSTVNQNKHYTACPRKSGPGKLLTNLVLLNETL